MRGFGERADGGVHIVGSVPAADAPSAMRAVADVLGDRLRRVPDGETGERADWIAWQHPILAASLTAGPANAATPGEGGYRGLPLLEVPATGTWRLASGLGYAAAAIASYDVFRALRAAAVIPRGVRFQVSLPTPLSPVAAFVAPGSQPDVEPVYEAAMRAELGTILGAIDHADLAVQWDANFEFGMLDGALAAWFADPRAAIAERLVRLGELVPVDVELGFHFCLDHLRLGHAVPYDTQRMADMALTLARSMRRRIDWLHLPVPEHRLDVTFFEKLATLAARPDIALYLGLVHLGEGDMGTAARVTAARRYLRHFGIASPCGWGRHQPADLTELLRLHADASRPLPPASPDHGRAPARSS